MAVVTVISKHFEMGQGAATGLATLIADELDADWSKVGIEFAPNDPTIYNNLIFGPVMATGGSTTIRNAFMQMRQVGATARAMFVTAAAQAWGVPEVEITVSNGVVSHAASGNASGFGALAEPAMRVAPPAEPVLKAPEQWTLIGKRIPRLDSPPKTTGEAVFAMDYRRPGMLTAVIARSPRFGGTVSGFDANPALGIPGVREVVQIPQGVAVVADDTWAALRGRDALEIDWDFTNAENRSDRQMLEEYRAMASGPGLEASRRGDAASALARADQVIEAEITLPFLAHAPMEPLNCTMELTENGAEMWSGCQLQSIDMYVAAQVLGLEPQQVKINTLYGGGSFGRRGNPVGDWVAELASIVKAIETKAPVHLVWTREDDIRGGFYRPLTLHKIRAGLTADGAISGWEHAIVCKSIFTGTPFAQMVVHDGVDHASVEGCADTPYAIGDFAVDSHNAETPIPVLWWRSVGHSHTAFAMETMLDELSHKAGKDPVEFRVELLGEHPRAVAVIRDAAERAGWGEAMPEGRGRGIAFHHSFGAYLAMVAEVAVADGELSVDRIIASVDCGVAVNPDVVEAQIEGAIGFALSSVTRNAITLENGEVQEANFDSFNPTRMREMPDVEVRIIPSTEPPAGIGEPGVPPIAPAISNAVFAATGQRSWSLPLNLSA